MAEIVTMDFMFEGAVFFNHPVDQWETSSALNMEDIFYGALSFVNIWTS
ncbi:BspA family leucine-rich repeat surface protein [archaeon]|nr:MAG: BspA family leucine-rich repeat surface protein [archaeon]